MGTEKYGTHRHTDTQTYRHTTESWGREGCTFLMGNMSAYLGQSVYFTGQTQVKIKLQQLLMQGERSEVWWAHFPKGNEA
jgi:hypothetical protein